jgi:hypothetical protein
MKLLLEIFSHARNDEGMHVYSQYLSEPADMSPCAQIRWQERRLRMFLLEIFENRKRLNQRRALAVEQRWDNHLWIERSIGRVKLITLEQIQRNRFGD